MSTTHVISALVAKRAELSGLVIDLARQKAAIKIQVNHIDNSLAIFNYRAAPRDIKPVRPKVYRFERRELGRLIQRFDKGGANTSIALGIIGSKAWDVNDLALVAKVSDSVKNWKNYQSRKARGDAWALTERCPYAAHTMRQGVCKHRRCILSI